MSEEPRNDGGEELVQAAKAYIAAHSREKFSLQAVADALYINKSYLLRRFKAHTGRTLLEYHNLVRCEQAKQLLSDTEFTISEVGETVGFVSSSHFTHVFRKNAGVTPTEYRGACAERGRDRRGAE